MLHQRLQEFFGGFGEGLVFFPNNAHLVGEARGERAECQPAVFGGVDDPVKGDGVPQALFHKKGGVEQQVVGDGDV